jgi:CRP/FNR family transcriptional regulator
VCHTFLVSITRQRDVAAAVAGSPLRVLPKATVERLFEHAWLIEVPLGAVPQRHGEERMVPGFLVSGVLRVFQSTPDGRQLTVRYARAGALLALATIYMNRTGPLSQQALTPCRLVRFAPTTLIAAAERDPAVANLFALETARRMFEYLDEMAGNTFGTMRQRVVRHLVDLAAANPVGAALVARTSQQALADSVGSVREVVVRVLRALREEGLIRTRRDQIELLHPDRLVSETFPRDS